MEFKQRKHILKQKVCGALSRFNLETIIKDAFSFVIGPKLSVDHFEYPSYPQRLSREASVRRVRCLLQCFKHRTIVHIDILFRTDLGVTGHLMPQAEKACQASPDSPGSRPMARISIFSPGSPQAFSEASCTFLPKFTTTRSVFLFRIKA
ncbi:hypothetical protein BDV96DRAFT_11489 [Lophiotrema nucula]|uniref:Uncharacterized protein n=1 Tax=Lophiotrema nucula TaxID=690887 RepID=A0A6A5ZTE9_9PLEO|nr:hypothetical protein BDV96DRAFT_11489 [Lophiotrema nucula]